MVDLRSAGRIFKQGKRSAILTDISHDLHACGNILMHIDIIRGMYTSLGIGDILVRMCGSWEKIMVDLRSSGRIFKQVKRSAALTDLSHDLHACGNVLMHIDIIRGMYTSLGTGDILVRMFGSWENIMVYLRISGRIFKQVKRSAILTDISHDLHACGNILMHIDIIRGMYTSLGTGDILVRMCGSWEKIMVDLRSSRRIFKQVKRSAVLTDLSHDLHACGNVLMHIHIITEMYTSLGIGDILVRMFGSWENIMVYLRISGRIFKQVKRSAVLTDRSHELDACGNFLMHIVIISGMYTSLGRGHIPVRMCGSWEKMMVDLRSSGRIFKQVKRFAVLTDLSHDLHACGNVLMHIDIIRGMYTSLGTGYILVRMCGSWEKVMVDLRSSGRIFKQVKRSAVLLDLSHDLHACGNVLMHIDIIRGMYTSLGTGDILVRMCGSWEKIMVDLRSSGRIFKQVKRSAVLTDLSHDLHACSKQVSSRFLASTELQFIQPYL